MAPVYREVELEWKGETYKVTPSYRLIQEIEQRVSISMVITGIAAAQPKLSQVAFVLASLLRAARCKDADEEEIYDVLHSALFHGGDKDLFTRLCVVVSEAFAPQRPSTRGNGQAPEAGAARGRRTGRTTTSPPSGNSGSNPQSSGG